VALPPPIIGVGKDAFAVCIEGKIDIGPPVGFVATGSAIGFNITVFLIGGRDGKVGGAGAVPVGFRKLISSYYVERNGFSHAQV
jgi:hypothetical protein